MNPFGRLLQNPKLCMAALAVYWLALSVATHVPSDFPAMPPARTDKIVHAAAFAVLAWLLARTWQLSAGQLNGSHLRAAWLAIVLYAAADELTQPWFGRTCSLADWLADLLGAAGGIVLFAWMQQKRPGG